VAVFGIGWVGLLASLYAVLGVGIDLMIEHYGN
jgi:hypothetical protein